MTAQSREKRLRKWILSGPSMEEIELEIWGKKLPWYKRLLSWIGL